MAESLYWIGRYVERAEDTARITDVNYHYTLEMGASPEAELRRRRHWEALIAIVGDEQRFHDAYPEASEETVPAYLTFDATNANSIVSCVARARQQALTLRHQVASEMWEALNRFHLELQRQARDASRGDDRFGVENAHLFYRSVIEFSQLFQGISDSTMPREEGWHFLQAGKFLERAEKTARAIDVKYHLLVADAAPAAPIAGPGFDAAATALTDASSAAGGVPGGWHQWLAVLHSLSAYEAYHRLYRTAVRPRTVVELLTLSPTFPRSIRFAVGEVEEALAKIAAWRAHDVARGGQDGHAPPRPAAVGGEEDAARAVGRLHAALEFGMIDEIFDAGLHAYLVDVQRRCYQVGEHIQTQYFAPRVMRPEEAVA